LKAFEKAGKSRFSNPRKEEKPVVIAKGMVSQVEVRDCDFRNKSFRAVDYSTMV